MFCQNRARLLSRWRAALNLLPALVLEMALVLPLGGPTANALPTGLPTHFAFGIGAGAGDTWMPQSGIPWDFRFQYLVGGVNTGSGWETWNANGTFALNYANESAQLICIPFDYEQKPSVLFGKHSSLSSWRANI